MVIELCKYVKYVPSGTLLPTYPNHGLPELYELLPGGVDASTAARARHGPEPCDASGHVTLDIAHEHKGQDQQAELRQQKNATQEDHKSFQFTAIDQTHFGCLLVYFTLLFFLCLQIIFVEILLIL